MWYNSSPDHIIVTTSIRLKTAVHTNMWTEDMALDNIGKTRSKEVVSKTKCIVSMVMAQFCHVKDNSLVYSQSMLKLVHHAIYCSMFPQLKWYSVLKNYLEIDDYNAALRWYTCTHNVYSRFNDICNSKCAFAAVLLLSLLLSLLASLQPLFYFRVRGNKMSHRK